MDMGPVFISQVLICIFYLSSKFFCKCIPTLPSLHFFQINPTLLLSQTCHKLFSWYTFAWSSSICKDCYSEITSPPGLHNP
jgi:hypothetical protein